MVKIGIHYTNEENWRKIQSASNDRKSLLPHVRLVRLRSITDLEIPKLPDWAHESYVFAFPDKPVLSAWRNYSHPKFMWSKLAQDIGDDIIELKFDLLPTDEAFVVDRAPFADWQFGYQLDRQEAIRRYALSRVKADEYKGDFRMPELIIRNSIEADRLKPSRLIKRSIVKASIGYKTVFEYSPAS